MWLTQFWHSWSQFFIFAWDVTAGGILRTGVLICLVFYVIDHQVSISTYIYRYTSLSCTEWPMSSWWLPMPWCQIGTRSSATTMLNHHDYNVTWNIFWNIHITLQPLNKLVFWRGWEVIYPLVSLILLGSFSHCDNAQLLGIKWLYPKVLLQKPSRVTQHTEELWLFWTKPSIS